MKEFLKAMFSEKAAASSMRWVFVWTYLYAVCLPIGAWALVYVKGDGKADIPVGVAGLVSAIIVAVTTGKVWQYFLETKEKGDGKPDSVAPAA